MKTLDRKAAEIFRALLALQTTKIDNSDGTYMPVSYTHLTLPTICSV